ncbi:hypothetical protein BGX31_007826 [Mortierella sp. GBA43]|nr:hypothetical protein BGX31_007826 [Mortierella sp. GBA43]
MTRSQIADYFRVPRTTIYGILKSRETLLGRPQAAQIQDSYRIAESRFKILEEVLMIWFHDLRSRLIPVNRKKITAQAFDVHRMLSGLLAEPLPPCLFTSGWLNGFKRRRRIDFDATCKDSTITMGDKLTNESLSRYSKGDIYSCEMTSMYLNLAPLAPQDGSSQKIRNRIYSSSASIVLCFNADGTHRRDPLVVIRQYVPDAKLNGYHRTVLNVDGGDLNKPTLLDWLRDFDRSLSRQILLIVDEAIWELLIGDKRSFQTVLKMIKVIKPATGASELPVSAGIAKMFKSFYYRRLLDIGPETDMLDSYLSLIKESWDGIRRIDIWGYFAYFLKRQSCFSTPSLLTCDDRFNDTMHKDLCAALKKAFPDASNTAIQYFDNLDKDTDFGIVRIVGLQPKMQSFRRTQAYSHGNVLVPLSALSYLGSSDNSEASPLVTSETAPHIPLGELFVYNRKDTFGPKPNAVARTMDTLKPNAVVRTMDTLKPNAVARTMDTLKPNAIVRTMDAVVRTMDVVVTTMDAVVRTMDAVVRTMDVRTMDAVVRTMDVRTMDAPRTMVRP